MNIKTVEITKEDVSEKKWNEIIDKLGLYDASQQQAIRVSVVTFVDHDKVVRENFRLNAEYKALKGCVKKAVQESEVNNEFLKTYLD